MNKNQQRKRAMLGFALFFSFLFVCSLSISLHFNTLLSRDTIEISHNGKVFGQYSTLADQTISIGDRFTVQIRNGEVFVAKSQCPDQLCIKQGKLNSFPIVCAPEKIVIRYLNTEESSYDAISK